MDRGHLAAGGAEAALRPILLVGVPTSTCPSSQVLEKSRQDVLRIIDTTGNKS